MYDIQEKKLSYEKTGIHISVAATIGDPILIEEWELMKIMPTLWSTDMQTITTSTTPGKFYTG